jgi:hypothetical protein
LESLGERRGLENILSNGLSSSEEVMGEDRHEEEELESEESEQEYFPLVGPRFPGFPRGLRPIREVCFLQDLHFEPEHISEQLESEEELSSFLLSLSFFLAVILEEDDSFFIPNLKKGTLFGLFFIF